MLVELSSVQARVIGVLLEKEVTTPEQYPLSLNALCLGCNQKSSREPVMNLSESEVQNAIDVLREKKLIFEEHTGSRVAKYKHRFCDTPFSDLQFTPQQKAIICLLLLRGAQTPGELRTRSARLAEFSHVDEVEASLQELSSLKGETIVVQLAKEAGKREARYQQLFSEPAPTQTQAQASPTSVTRLDPSDKQRITALEHEVSALKEELSVLRTLIKQHTE